MYFWVTMLTLCVKFFYDLHFSMNFI
uniref:Uncharacterized protein n=1 Tax=Anguilla anguilla TaxID=7936 RepID=A0A0E9RQC1_ANGAN